MGVGAGAKGRTQKSKSRRPATKTSPKWKRRCCPHFADGETEAWERRLAGDQGVAEGGLEPTPTSLQSRNVTPQATLNLE